MSETNILVAAIAGIAAFFIACQVKEKKSPEPQQAIEENVVYPPTQRDTISPPLREWDDQYAIDASSDSPPLSRMDEFKNEMNKMSSAMGSFDNQGGRRRRYG